MGIAALNPSYKIPESVLVVIGGAKVRVKYRRPFIFQLGTDLRGMRPGQPPRHASTKIAAELWVKISLEGEGSLHATALGVRFSLDFLSIFITAVRFDVYRLAFFNRYINCLAGFSVWA